MSGPAERSTCSRRARGGPEVRNETMRALLQRRPARRSVRQTGSSSRGPERILQRIGQGPLFTDIDFVRVRAAQECPSAVGAKQGTAPAFSARSSRGFMGLDPSSARAGEFVPRSDGRRRFRGSARPGGRRGQTRVISGSRRPVPANHAARTFQFAVSGRCHRVPTAPVPPPRVPQSHTSTHRNLIAPTASRASLPLLGYASPPARIGGCGRPLA